jgi:hypothetical protein
MSMALRYDHGLGCPGYYDQPIFQTHEFSPSHAQRLESTIGTMRQIYEEVSGYGFYKPEKEAEYEASYQRGKQPDPDQVTMPL